MKMYIPVLVFVFLLVAKHASTTTITFPAPASCSASQSYDVFLLKCVTCKNGTLKSGGGFGCECAGNSRYAGTDERGNLICEKCPANHTLAQDKRHCLPCHPSVPFDEKLQDCSPCQEGSVRIERHPNGQLLDEVICMECASNAVAVNGSSCTSCFIPLVGNNTLLCNCSNSALKFIGGYCFTSSAIDKAEERHLFYRDQHFASVDVKSVDENALVSLYLCKYSRNAKACQHLGNLCVLLQYIYSEDVSACGLYYGMIRSTIHSFSNVPWLYYSEGEIGVILNRAKSATTYIVHKAAQRSILNFVIGKSDIHGNFLGFQPFAEFFKAVCPEGRMFWQSNFQFGINYQQSCELQVPKMKTVHFFDMYLAYENGKDFLQLPVRNLNFRKDKVLVNELKDELQWQLVRRFYLMNTLAQYEAPFPENAAQGSIVLSYLKYFNIKVVMRNVNGVGRIFVPYVTVSYDQIVERSLESHVPVLTFSMTYEMDKDSYRETFMVTCSIASLIAAVFAVIRTWIWYRRSGKSTLQRTAAWRLCENMCECISNALLLAIFGMSVYWVVFFKSQSTVYTALPAEDIQQDVTLAICLVFVMKTCQITLLLWRLASIDIFFVDWEKPRLVNAPSKPNKKSSRSDKLCSPSAWRTLSVANKWVALHALRKTSIPLQLVLTLVFFKIFHFENLATAEPEWKLTLPKDTYHAPANALCHYAVGSLVYIGVFMLQFMFCTAHKVFFYDEMLHLVDLCSVSNISVFILKYANVGFYIHGRSAHGFSDTDMYSMIEQLQREAEDLCGHRGLLMSDDQQTFEMSVPRPVGEQYRKLLAPVVSYKEEKIAAPIKRMTRTNLMNLKVKLPPRRIELCKHAYPLINDYLSKFIEHGIAGLDYVVHKKPSFSQCFGLDFRDRSGKGIFYSDKGHSFEAVMFCGNEFVFALFDLVVFGCIDLVVQDYVCATVIAYFSALAVKNIGNSFMTSNVAKKSLIDKRFFA